MNVTEEEILKDPAASHWLKRQIEETKKRDPVDALNDAEVLSKILENRLDSVGKVEGGKDEY